jgi:hypothetical protein
MDAEPLKRCVNRCQSMENRLACLFFFLAILYDDEVVGVNNSHRVTFGPDKQRNSRLVINWSGIWPCECQRGANSTRCKLRLYSILVS